MIGALERGVLRGEIELGDKDPAPSATRILAPAAGWPGPRSPGADDRRPRLVVPRAMSMPSDTACARPRRGARSSSRPSPGKVYRDRDTGEELEVIGKVLPLAPSVSKLPWAVENLRICNWCDQLSQKDLNDCPHCGRRMAPLARS